VPQLPRREEKGGGEERREERNSFILSLARLCDTLRACATLCWHVCSCAMTCLSLLPPPAVVLSLLTGIRHCSLSPACACAMFRIFPLYCLLYAPACACLPAWAYSFWWRLPAEARGAGGMCATGRMPNWSSVVLLLWSRCNSRLKPQASSCPRAIPCAPRAVLELARVLELASCRHTAFELCTYNCWALVLLTTQACLI